MNLYSYQLMYNRKNIDYPEELPEEKFEYMDDYIQQGICPMCEYNEFKIYSVSCPLLKNGELKYYEFECQKCSSSYYYGFKTDKDLYRFKIIFGIEEVG